MAKRIQNNLLNDLSLAAALEDEVRAWADQGWQGVTQTTYELLAYWFNREQETDETFHLCQQRAIETIIYCHEVLGIETLKQAFERFNRENIRLSFNALAELSRLDLKRILASGAGKLFLR